MTFEKVVKTETTPFKETSFENIIKGKRTLVLIKKEKQWESNAADEKEEKLKREKY